MFATSNIGGITMADVSQRERERERKRPRILHFPFQKDFGIAGVSNLSITAPNVSLPFSVPH